VGRSVDNEKVGSEDSAPKSATIADAEVFILTEGNIPAAAIARMPEVVGVSGPRHAFIGILQELGKTSQSPLAMKIGGGSRRSRATRDCGRSVVRDLMSP
jgi:hypothetical protein